MRPPRVSWLFLIVMTSLLMTSSSSQCDSSSWENDYATPTLGSDKKLTCSLGSKLMHGSKQLDNAKCDDATGWKGNTDETLIDFAKNPQAKLRVKCHEFCSESEIKDACPSCTITLQNTNKKISCDNAVNPFLKIGDKFYKEAVCSDDGWKSGIQTLIDFKTNPFEKIQAVCEPCLSMFEDKIDPSYGKKPKYETTLHCNEHRHHYLMVDDKLEPVDNVICSATGWKADTETILDYTNTVVKLKAKCLSRCHTLFVDRSCTPPCSKPIYLNEGEPLFCRRANEQLVLNGKDVPDVTCDLAKGGWIDASGALLLPFTQSPPSVKASCRSNPAPPPPVMYDTDSASASVIDNAGAHIGYIVAIGFLLAAIIIGFPLFFWWINKRKRGGRDDEEEGKSKTRSKSSSRKNKKGKKNKKSDRKKKNKKESKKDQAIDIDSNVEVPGHQMSMETSAVPLTAAAVAAAALVSPAPQNPNVMGV